MRRKEVSNHLGAVAEARASLAAHRPRVGPKLDARLPPPDGEATFSYQVYFDHMDRELEQVEQRLTVAEDEHVHKLAQVVQLRRQRDELTPKVYDKQSAARQVVAGFHGREHGFEVAAVSGPTPQEAKPLAEQVDQTTKMLRNPPGELPSGRIAGVNLDYETMASDLETDLETLQGVRQAYQRTRKEVDGTRQTVNAEIAELKAVFPWVARTLEGFFRLVGERELADRIRSSRRRVTRRQDEGEEEAADSPPTEEGEAPAAESSS